MLLSTAIQDFLDAMVGVRSKATIAWYKVRLRTLEDFFSGETDVASITLRDLRRWWKQLAEREERYQNHPLRPVADGGLSPHTLHGYVRVAHRFFRWLVEEEVCESNPARRLEKPPLPEEPPKAITEQDLELILEASRDNPRDYAIVCFLADTGCRVGGAAGLLLKDLDLENRRALVREKGRGGKRKARTVYMKPRSVEALSAYLETRKDNPEPL